MNAKVWNIVYEDWESDNEPLRDTLRTLGNGYFSTCGAAEESVSGAKHYPGTYLDRGI